MIEHFHFTEEDKLKNQLSYQGSFFSSIMKFLLSQVNTIWSCCQSKLPKNIFNFTVRYINNSLPTRRNMTKWGLSPSIQCSFCLPESLLHVVAGCKFYLDQFTWQHDSIPNFIANPLQSFQSSTMYVYVPGFTSPSVVTGNKHQPDLLLTTKHNCLYILELTVGYETNLRNDNRKQHM